MKDDKRKKTVPKGWRRHPLVDATIDVLGVSVKVVCDPFTKICYPALEQHWLEHYRKPWPDKYARRMLILDFTLVTIIASLIVLSGAIYFILPLFPSPANVRLDVVSPQSLVSGRSETFSVTYANDSADVLGCASLRVHLPPGAALTTDIPARTDSEAFCNVSGPTHGTVIHDASGETIVYDIGNVEPHANGLVTFDAAAYAPSGSSQRVMAELFYWQSAGTSATRVSAVKTWPVEDAVLRLTGTPPASLVRGRVATMTYSYENASSNRLSPVVLRLAHPDDFVLTGASLPGLRGEWTLGSLDPGQKGTFTLQGYFSDVPTGSVTAPVLTLDAVTDEGGTERLLNEVRQNLDPKASGFSLTQDLGALELRPGLVPGDAVHVTVRYANQGTQPIKDATITVYADGRMIEQASPAELSWNWRSVPALADIAPGASGTLDASFVVRRELPVEPEDEAPTLAVSTVATFALPGDADGAIRAGTAQTVLPLTTRLGVNASAFYYTKDGDQLGIGPLPPRVGQTTKYRVVAQLTNTTGAVSGATFEASLPPGAEWTGQYSVSQGESIDWLPSSRRIRWVVGELPAYAGTVGENIGASFEVALTPAPEQAGEAATLLTDISVDGKDARTGLSLHSEAQPITTELPFDPRAAGKGVVVKR